MQPQLGDTSLPFFFLVFPLFPVMFMFRNSGIKAPGAVFQVHANMMRTGGKIISE